ncbi:MAG: hypothetical protein MI673_09230 [Thiotrichales bacterium]|nr:hypothetical protein [Thiotrichales bacterium]
MTRKLIGIVLYFAVPLFIVMLIVLSLSSYWMYSRFNIEKPIAELVFRPFDESVYIAEVRTGDFCFPQEFPVYGDQWQLDAGFLKWKGAGVMLGFESLYRLDRLSGRYSDINEQNTRRTRSHDLRPEVWFDPFESGLLNQGHWLIDTRFGSSVYLDIDTAKKYIVYKTEDALIVKQTPGKSAIEGQNLLDIEISRACGNDPGIMDKLAREINRLAVRYVRF